MNHLFLIGAMLLMCVAHIIRIIRWQFFIEIYEKPNSKNLMRALSVGYLLSYIIPFKLGDLARVWISGKKMKNGKALALSTVIVDRYFDIIAVGVVFMMLAAITGNEILHRNVFFYVASAGAMLLFAATIYLFKDCVKRGVVAVAKFLTIP